MYLYIYIYVYLYMYVYTHVCFWESRASCLCFGFRAQSPGLLVQGVRRVRGHQGLEWVGFGFSREVSSSKQ